MLSGNIQSLCFSDVLRGFRKRSVAWNGLIMQLKLNRYDFIQHKKWSFPLRNFLVIVTISAGNWRDLLTKSLLENFIFVQCHLCTQILFSYLWPTIIFIIFWDFLIFTKFPFHHKWNNGWLLHSIYELPHELPSNVRLEEWYPSAQSPCQNKNFVNTSRKLLKNKK